MLDSTKDRFSSIVLLILALFFCVGSLKLTLGSLHRPGPGFFSFVTGSILAVFSTVLFLRSFKRSKENEPKPFWPNPQRSIKMTLVVIALILYTIGMDYVGFIYGTLLFLIFLLRSIKPQRWSVVLLISILSTLIFYGIFKLWLGVMLPEGFW